MLETEGGRKMTECRPALIAEYSGEARSVVGRPKTSVRFLEVMVVEKTIARPTQGPKIRTGMTKNTNLPDRIETFDSGVAAGFFRRNESKMDAQQEVKTDDLGETVAIPSSSCRRHLVIHLGDPGKPHNSPGINQMTTKRDRSLVAELAGCGGLSGDINGMDGIEAGDSSGPSEMTGPDQVGLLKVAHLTSRDIGIGRSAGSTLDLDLLCLAGPGQDLLDGRDSREPTYSSSLNLEMDRFGADTGEGGASGSIVGQFVAQVQDIPDQRLRRLVGDMSRHPTLVTKSLEPELSISTKPFGHPKSAPMDSLDDFHKSHSVPVKTNGFLSSLVFALDAHRKNLLPGDMGKSLCDEQIAYRCPYGFSLSDVHTETHY